MNPVIERILEMENNDKCTVKKVKEEDVDITAVEMAKIYQQESTLIETVGKKFKNPKFNSSSNKRRKFMKPLEEEGIHKIFIIVFLNNIVLFDFIYVDNCYYYLLFVYFLLYYINESHFIYCTH